MNTHLIAHAAGGSILVTENDSAPDNFGYELADVERIPADTSSVTSIEAALETAGYFVSGRFEFDSLSGDTIVGVRQR